MASETSDRRSLVVVGAAVGMGRWLVDHLLARTMWHSVTLVDLAERADDLRQAAAVFGSRGPDRAPNNSVTAASPRTESPDYEPSAPAVRHVIWPSDASDGPRLDTGEDSETLVVIAVPPGELEGVARRLAAENLAGATLAVVSDRLVEATRIASARLPGCAIAGLHPLFERGAASLEGQIVYLVPPPPRPSGAASVDLAGLVRAGGGVVSVGTAERHDQIMKYVQAAAHQTLLNFVDVLTRSGLDLERDLWAARTPLFEALFGLATRVLDPRQRSAVEQIQATPGAKEVAEELLASAVSTSSSIATTGITARRLDEIGAQMSGSLFSTARHVAQVAVTAAQSTRAELSRRRANGDLVGIHLDRRPDLLHVGRIVDVGPTDVVIDDLLLPGSGRGGVLAAGPGLANGARVGAKGTARRVVLNIGQLTLLSADELDRELDARLAFIRRDVRFLVPESVSGNGVLRALVDIAGTRDHEVVSEVVRTGQRAVVIKLAIRADHDLDDTVESMRAVVQQIYAWPLGICRPATATVSRVAYLGPAGTFSEAAARQCAQAAGLAGAELVAFDSFDDVLAALVAETIAVVPISSSSSGLVTRAFNALWAAGGELTTGGMVDVSVRIDAYIPAATSLEQLRGAQLFSHPQALAQCNRFIRRWRLQPVECASTVEALRIAAASGRAVALAAAGADLFALPLKVGEREVDDLSGSITRFLIVGPPAAFDQFSTEHAPTTRTVFLGRSPQREPAGVGVAAYEEVLADADGNYLLVTSRTDVRTDDGLRRLGSTPWSPRTPVVRVSATSP